jgi:hypothetical protein
MYIMVFDLTNLRGDAHGRAFEDVTSVVSMSKQRLGGRQGNESRLTPG